VRRVFVIRSEYQQVNLRILSTPIFVVFLIVSHLAGPGKDFSFSAYMV
jgi:hypothetical protein